MGWDIKVWHEELGDRVRISIEAGPEVPDDVVSAVAGSYWFEEVQQGPGGWEMEEFDAGQENSGPRLQG